MDKWVRKLVQYNIDKGKISKEDADIYKFGYTLLFEKAIIFLITLLIAFIFDAFLEVLIFCIAFIPLRVYSGGYHAKSTIKCMILSGFVLICNILAVQQMSDWEWGKYFIILELVLFPLLITLSPVEHENRKIEESERRYFRHMVLGIYIIELAIEIIFLVLGWNQIVLGFVLAHVVNAGVVVISGKRRRGNN